MAEPNVLTIRVPLDLKQRIARTAEEQGVSINQLAMYMFTKELSDLETGKLISDVWKQYSKKEIMTGFDEVMSKVKDKKVPDWDRLG
ncbi:conserved hypothetical protein [Desulfamplus magnetovallimortis]|uniref:Toxin-antitoxin system HicB family antitoxin n=1 Tax=Desulfamplus magnetovallimortis TaxID=1246637 RepID=A0A1W1HIW4_9BACT|nr:toxin-antitoxin system HicB family antitoxin [Desulfamplus magnetovallimortis]SLM32302.1 conserved hypothetical protein [Desulfamplus magnetovallimortis]